MWARQEQDSDRSFAAFRAYRDLGPKRKFRFAELPEIVNESSAQIHDWSRRHAWTARAAAWDDYKDQRRRDVEIDELERMTRRQIRLGRKMQRAAIRTVDKMKPSATNPEGIDVPRSTLPQWAKAGVDIERLAKGLTTEHMRVDQGAEEDADFERILADPEARAHLERASRRAASLESVAGPNGGEAVEGEVEDEPAPRAPE